MSTIEDSFRPFETFLKVYGFKKIVTEKQKKILKHASNAYFFVLILLLISHFKSNFANFLNRSILDKNDGPNLIFLKTVFHVDVLMYDFCSSLFYFNTFRQRKSFENVLSLLKKFDLKATGHGIFFNYEKTRNQSLLLICAPAPYFLFLLGFLGYHSKSVFALMSLIKDYFFYYVYVVESALIIFIMWNILKRLENLNQKIVQFKMLNFQLPYDTMLLLEVVPLIISEMMNGFTWSFLMILCEFTLVQNNY